MNKSPFSLIQKLQRLFWSIAWIILFRPFPRRCFGLRRFLINLFGGHIDSTARIYGTAKIWAPWNLVMKASSTLGDHVDCYNVAMVTLQEGVVVSQYAYLCTASHDINDPEFRLISAPIVINKNAWICAKAVIGMGLTIGEGAVAAIGSVVIKQVEPWTIVGGNPAKFIKMRIISKQIKG